MIREEDAARPKHPADVGQRERLLEYVVVHQDVGRDDEIVMRKSARDCSADTRIPS